MPFSNFDLIVCVCILVCLIGAAWWLLVIGKRLEGLERERISRWHHDYFHKGGLARALIGKWSRQRRLTDRTDVPGD